jgi:Putative adhesin
MIFRGEEDMSEERLEKEFTVPSPASLVVRNIRGKVQIEPGPQGVLRLTAIKYTDSGDASHTELQVTQDKDGTVNAIARFPEGSLDWLFGAKPCKVDFIIQAPPECSLRLNGVSNDVEITGLTGSHTLHSVSGDLVLKHLSGDLDVHTVSGDVDLLQVNGKMNIQAVSGDVSGENAAGHVRLDTVSGDIHLSGSNLPAVDARTVSGDVDLQTVLGEGPYRFNSVSGEVRLVIPSDSHCSAELHSLSGNLESSLPATSRHSGRGHHSLEIGGGGVKVLLHSVSGDLVLVT